MDDSADVVLRTRREAPQSTVFGGCIPVLRVSDVARSVRYYVENLGFAHNWGDERFASVSRGAATLFLSQGDQGHPGAWVFIGVDDAAAAVDELQGRGALIRHGPSNFPWALEAQVTDPDGNVLRLGSDPLPGVPWGEWLDMRGVRWRLGPDGLWTAVAT